tara:strand:- start:2324 stop:2503 length:180 start_codon:yes stop_codon:yes gene_type:complete
MSKTKAWLMDMDEHISDAFDNGAKTEKEVILYCKTHMELPIDEKYITDTFKTYVGERDV